MRTVCLTLLLAILTLGVTPSGLNGQAIDGFASVPWGASRAEIEEAWGRPTRVDEDGSVLTFRYGAQNFAGPQPIRGWNMLFNLRGDRLLSGRYVGLFEREPIAQEARRRMVEEIHSRYSFYPPRDCPKPYDEARSCALYVNAAVGEPQMEQISGSWRTLMIWIVQEYGEWALITEYMTAAEKAASFREEDRRY